MGARWMGSEVRCLLLIVVMAIASSAVYGQLYTGSLTGVVTDPTEGVIPGVAVRVTDADRGFTFDATTDANGRFLFRNLPPGRYGIETQAAGFKKYVRSGITLDINQNAELNIRLDLGSTTDTVQVTAETTLISTQDAVTGQSLNRSAINNLPLINRAVFDLAFLAPGVSQPAGNAFGPGSSPNNFISNGSRNATADIIIDGVSTVNYEQNSGIQLALYTPSVDAIEEFKVQQSNFSADIGFSGSTYLNVIFRSGTNDFHGSTYYFHRNDALDANNFFNNANGVKKAPSKWNQYGVTFGGPIVRNKTFFFVDWEGTRKIEGSTHRNGVPSAAERSGDFGELCSAMGGEFSSNGACSEPEGQIWDPYTSVYDPDQGGPVRQNFIPFNNMATYISPGNTNLGSRNIAPVPGNLIDPVAFKMMQYYPLPNVGVGTENYDRFHNWIGSGSGINNNDQFDVKIDHRFTDFISLAGRISYGHNTGHSFNCFDNIADPCTSGPGSGGPKAAVLNYTHTLNASTIWTVSYGVTRDYGFTRGAQEDFPDFDPVTTLGMPDYIKASGITATPYIYTGAYGDIGSQPWSVLRQGQEVHHLISSVSRMVGPHELKFGGEMRMHRISFLQAGAPAGVFAYDYNGTSQYPWEGGGDALATTLIGTSSDGWGEYEIPAVTSTQNFQYAGFVQDNWRVNDRLTLNLGLRYDLDMPRTERYDRMSYIQPDVPTGITVPGFENLRGGLGFTDKNTRSPFEADYRGFEPRFGFAYRLRENTVLRGGYGIFHSLSKGGAAGAGAYGFTGFEAVTDWLSYNDNDGATPGGFLRDPFNGSIKYPSGRSLGTLTNLGGGLLSPIRAWGTRPYEQTWTFGIQQGLPWQSVFDISYVGKKGTHLYFGDAGSLNHLSADQAAAFVEDPGYWNEYVENPFAEVITEPSSALAGPEVQRYQLVLPYPQFSTVKGVDPPWANSSYHSLQMRFEKDFSDGVTFLTTYSFQKSIDDSSVAGDNITWLGGSVDSTIQNPNNRRLDRSLSQFDIRHIFQTSFQWELPFGRGKKFGGGMSPWVDAILGGWQTNGIYRLTGGQPLILTLSGGQAIPTYGQRANLSAPLLKADNWTLDQYFANPEVAEVPDAYTLGNASKTISTARGPGTNVMSFSLFKQFSLENVRQGMRMEFRVESFNFFNHPQFANPQLVVGQDDFGATYEQANSPRQMQLGLKIYF